MLIVYRKIQCKFNTGVLLCLLTLWVLGSSAQIYASDINQVSEREYTYEVKWEKDNSLKGLFDSKALYFQIGKWQVNKGVCNLTVSISSLINREVSYLTVLFDGQPVETLQLPDNKESVAEYRIELPVQKITQGYHSVTVQAYLRGQTTDACVDDSSMSTWLNILDDSDVTLYYEPLLECKSIAGFYEKFVSIEALYGKQSMLATGRDADDSVLTAMAQIVTGFAQNAQGDYEQIQSMVISDNNDVPRGKYIILIEKLHKLPPYLLNLMTQEQQKCARESAVICLVEYEGKNILLVTGDDQIGLKKAADILSNPMLIQMQQQLWQQVDKSKKYTTDSYRWEEYFELTQTGVQVTGNFEQTASFMIDSPINRKVSESAQLSLDYRFGANINFDKSLLTVRINGIPIGSRRLSKEEADGTTEVFDIPADIEVAGGFTVETVFELYPMGDNWCELTPEEVPWAYIADTSMLKWTTAENTEVYFEYYPYPFIRNAQMSDVLCILPKEWSQNDLNMMTGMLLTLGKWQKSNAGTLAVTSNPEQKDLMGKNIISIGNGVKNQMDTTEIESILDGGFGCAAITESKYGSSGQAMLVVSGDSDSSMLLCRKFLAKETNLWQLKGDLFYTDGTDVSVRYVRETKKMATAPKIDTQVEEDENIPFIIVCSVLILILLSSAMILLKYGRKRNEK